MRVLLLNQCFYPDVVSTAQHTTDLALKLVESGHKVTVIASRRGYDDLGARFPSREVWQGIEIIRIGSSGFGKSARWRRVLDFGSFMAGCALRLAVTPRFDVVVALTSPPLISFLAALFVRLKSGRFFFWVMDLNPDEAIAAGWLKEGSLAAKGLSSLLLYSFKHSEKVFVLDRFMKNRVLDKGVPESKLVVLPPWSHDAAARYDHEGRRAFRAAHGLSDRFVVMYSGNHSPCHPVDTILSAAHQLADRPDIVFCFVGGGSEFEKVKAFARTNNLANILCLPYQPLENLAASLSAADLHLVIMGDPFAGLVHPCKIYNILAVGVPFLYVGPGKSHIMDIVSENDDKDLARIAVHGDVEAVVAHICDAAAGADRPGYYNLAERYSMQALLPRMMEVLESIDESSAVCDAGASRYTA